MQITKEDDKTDEDALREELVSLLDSKPEGKKLFYRFSKKWRNFLDPLEKEDRLILLKMIVEVCIYNEGVSSMINMENSESYTDLMFFLMTIILQQKRIDRSNTLGKEKAYDF